MNKCECTSCTVSPFENIYTRIDGRCDSKMLNVYIKNNNMYMIKTILEKTKKLNYDKSLIHTCKTGNYNITKLLLDHKADPNIGTSIACKINRSNIINLLLDRDACPYQTARFACIYGRPSILLLCMGLLEQLPDNLQENCLTGKQLYFSGQKDYPKGNYDKVITYLVKWYLNNALDTLNVCQDGTKSIILDYVSLDNDHGIPIKEVLILPNVLRKIVSDYL